MLFGGKWKHLCCDNRWRYLGDSHAADVNSSSLHRCLHLSLISSVNTQISHWLEEWASVGFEQDVWERWKALFSSRFTEVSRTCVFSSDGYAYNGCQQQLKQEGWEWKTPPKSCNGSVGNIKQIFGSRTGRGEDDGSFEDLKHLPAPVLIACERTVLKETWGLTHTRDPQFISFSGVGGLWFVISLTSLHITYMFGALTTPI